MARNPLGAKITATIRLEKIEIRLSDYEPPTIEATGRMMTGNRRADMASTVTIRSGHIGPATAEFIREVKTVFSDRLSSATEGD